MAVFSPRLRSMISPPRQMPSASKSSERGRDRGERVRLLAHLGDRDAVPGVRRPEGCGSMDGRHPERRIRATAAANADGQGEASVDGFSCRDCTCFRRAVPCGRMRGRSDTARRGAERTRHPGKPGHPDPRPLRAAGGFHEVVLPVRHHRPGLLEGPGHRFRRVHRHGPGTLGRAVSGLPPAAGFLGHDELLGARGARLPGTALPLRDASRRTARAGARRRSPRSGRRGRTGSTPPSR